MERLCGIRFAIAWQRLSVDIALFLCDYIAHDLITNERKQDENSLSNPRNGHRRS